MATYVVRVWVPDRPGALGAVASRIGAVRGDLTGVDILERGGGRAIDELVVELPDADLVPLLVAEVGQVDGVDVEDVRPVEGSLPDPRLAALETAAFLVEQATVAGLLGALAERAASDFEADWTAVVHSDGGLSAGGAAGGPAAGGAPVGATVPLATAGSPPPASWLGAFVAGSRSSTRVAAGESGPDDVAWAALPSGDLALVLGRRGRPLRARERRQVAALSRIADRRWAELVARARDSHPSVASG